MLKLIENILNANGHCGDITSSDEMASILLYELELLGIKPPCRANFGGHGTLNERGNCDDYMECCDFSFEPEDEHFKNGSVK